MIQINTYSAQNKAPENTKKEIIDFLFESLDQYGDPKEDIEKCLDYAWKVKSAESIIAVFRTTQIAMCQDPIQCRVEELKRPSSNFRGVHYTCAYQCGHETLQ